MNEELRKNIAFAQTVVSLGRDLVLVIVAIFTVLIVYLGGEPKKLSEFDWALLVGSAIVVVTAPVLVFYTLTSLSTLLNYALGPMYYLWGETSKVPRGISLIWNVSIRKRGLKEYVKKWKSKRKKIQERMSSRLYYRLNKAFVSIVFRVNPWMMNSIRVIYPVMTLIVGAIMFYEFFDQYTKP